MNKEYEKAIADYDKVIKLYPKYYRAYFNKAYACELAGKKADALASYELFLKNAPITEEYESQLETAKQRVDELKAK